MKVNMGYGVCFRILTGCSVISDDSELNVTLVSFYSIVVLLETLGEIVDEFCFLHEL